MKVHSTAILLVHFELGTNLIIEIAIRGVFGGVFFPVSRILASNSNSGCLQSCFGQRSFFEQPYIYIIYIYIYINLKNNMDWVQPPPHPGNRHRTRHYETLGISRKSQLLTSICHCYKGEGGVDPKTTKTHSPIIIFFQWKMARYLNHSYKVGGVDPKYHGWSTYPPLTYPPPRNKGLIRPY